MEQPPALSRVNVETDCVVYGAVVTEVGNNKAETYTGVTAHTFKKRYGAHFTDMLNSKYSTCLSKHVWDLNDNGKQYSIQWCSSFNPITQK